MTMSTSQKTRVVNAMLVALTLWPLVHLWLVVRFDVSSWKLAGWGMYATPRLRRVSLGAFGVVRGTGARERLSALPSELQSETVAFIERHRFLRRLARPDAVGRALLDAHPEWERVVVMVAWNDVDRTSGMVVMKTAEYTYRPD